MKKLLILGAGIIQVPIIKKAKSMGYFTIVADYSSEAPGLKYADKSYMVSTIDKEAILLVAQKESIDGILTTSDYPVNVVAYVSRIMGLPAMSEEVANICTNKYLQREILKKNGIKTPFYKLCNSNEDLNKYKDFPYIVKPCDSSASRGVKKVNNHASMIEAFKEALNYSKSKNVLLESFIEGKEYSVETLTQKGKTTIITITEKFTKGEEFGFFVEDTHLEAARLSEIEKQMIETEVLKAIQVIGLDNCPSHTEVKLNYEGAFIIEMACRLGGDYITSDLVPLSTGVDMLENLIRLSVNEPIEVNHKFHKVSMIQFINQENYNSCNSFIKENKSSIIRYEIDPKHERPIKSSLDRMGYIILQLNDYQEFDHIMKQLNN